MQLWSVRYKNKQKNKRRKQTRKRRLLVSAMVVALPLGIIFLLFRFIPNELQFGKLFSNQKADGVSISYLSQLLKSRPDSWQLRYQLSLQLQKTGQLEKAWTTLKPLIKKADHNLYNKNRYIQTKLLQAQLAVDYISSISTSKNAHAQTQKNQWIKIFKQVVHQTPWMQASTLQLQKLASLSLAMGYTDTAANFYQMLSHKEPEHRFMWQNEAARWKLASGKSQEAADIYQNLANYTESHPITCQQCHSKSIDQNNPAITPTALKAYAWKNAASILRSINKYDDVFRVMQLAIKDQMNNPELLIQGIKIAAELQAATQGRRWLEQLIQLSSTHPYLKQAQHYAISMGLESIALKIAEIRLESESENIELRLSLAQLYRWRRMPDDALRQWLWLWKNSPDHEEQALENAWLLAHELYHFKTTIALLESTSKKRKLNYIELNALINTFIEVAMPEQAELWLSTYLAEHPDKKELWLTLANLQEDQHKIEDAIKTWKNINQRFNLDTADILSYAQLLQNNFRLHDTFQLLMESIDDKNKLELNQNAQDQISYWSMLAEIAWLSGNNAIAAMAAENALTLDPTHEASINKYLSMPELFSTSERLLAVTKGFEAHNNIYYATVVMALTAELERWQELHIFLQQLKADPRFKKNTDFWLAKAKLASVEGSQSDALVAHTHAINSTNDNDTIIISYFWYLLEQDRRDLLQIALKKWHSKAIKNEEYWQVFAFSLVAVGNTKQAITWLKKALALKPDDLTLQFALADLLSRTGLNAQAHVVKVKAIEHLRNSRHSPNDITWRPHYLNAITWLSGLANSSAWMRAYGRQEETWFSEIAQLLLASNNISAASDWLSRQQQYSLKSVPFSQQLTLALEGDIEQISRLLPEVPSNTPSHARGIWMLGDSANALATALNNINDYSSKAETLLSTEQVISYSSEHPAGWQVGMHLNDDDTVNRSGPFMTLAERFDNWHLQLQASHLKYRYNNDIIAANSENEFKANLQVTQLLNDGYWRGFIEGVQRSDATPIGLGLNRQIKGRHINLNFFGKYQTTSDLTALLTTFGRENQLGAELSYQLNTVDNFVVSGTFSQFNDQYQKNELGAGYQFKAIWQHKLLYRRPQWTLRAGIDWQQYELKNTLSEKLAEKFVQSATPALLLPEKYRYYYVGSRLQNGLPGNLNSTQQSPHWMIDLSLGWQQPENMAALNVSAGIGSQVLGRDELSLMLSYGNAPQGAANDDSYSLKLSYQYRFGR